MKKVTLLLQKWKRCRKCPHDGQTEWCFRWSNPKNLKICQRRGGSFPHLFLQGTCTPATPRLHDTTNQHYPSFWNSVSYFDFLPAAVLTEFTLEPIMLPNLVDSHHRCIANFIQDVWQDFRGLWPGTHASKVSVFTEGATGKSHKTTQHFWYFLFQPAFSLPFTRL